MRATRFRIPAAFARSAGHARAWDKRGGVRVFRFARLQHGELALLTIYAKAKFDNIPPSIARAMKEAYENA